MEALRQTFPERMKMNPLYIYSGLDKTQQILAKRLARGGGILGWNEKSLHAAHIRNSDLIFLESLRLVEQKSFVEIARQTVNNIGYQNEYEDLNRQGGFLSANSDDKKFISDFEYAKKIISERSVEISENRYHITDSSFHDFLCYWDQY